MVYDDDRDAPLTERIRRSDIGRKHPQGRTVGTAQTPATTTYRCSGTTADGTPCRRTKLGEPGYLCHDHIHLATTRGRAQR